jgi:hypothetical protein
MSNNAITYITVSQISEVIALHNTPGAKPVLLIGLPGLGKTTGVEAFCRKNGFDLYTYMLNQYTPPDFKGYLVPDKEARRMACFPTNELPWADNGEAYADKHGGKRPMVFLDEFLGASPAMFNLAQQLVHEKRIGENNLPPDVLIVAAANSAAMKCGSSKLTMSMADRFAIYHIRPDFDSTLDWMINHGINPWIVAFLQMQNTTGGGVLWSVTPDKWSGEEPIDSARSYTALSNILNRMDDDMLHGSTLLSALCKANLGNATGAKLSEFIKLSIEVGNIDDMIADPANAVLPSRPDLRWGIAARCVSCATLDNFDNIMELAVRLTPDSMKPDGDAPTMFEAFVIQSVVKVKPQLIAGNKSWLKWVTKNSKHLAIK